MSTSRPTFVGIGAPRCGTTWLHVQLQSHPDIWLPPLKELHFFDAASRYTSPGTFQIANPLRRLVAPGRWGGRSTATALGQVVRRALRGDTEAAAWWMRVATATYDDSFYPRLFPGAGYRATGEFTPAYSLLDTDDIRRIHAVNPDMRLIFMARDPIERAWSSLRYNVGRGRLALDLTDGPVVVEHLKAEAVRRGTGIVRGEFRQTIEAYLEVFRPDQLLVGFFDAIAQDPHGILADLCAHLGVPGFAFPKAGEAINAAAKESDIPAAVRDHFASVYEEQNAFMADRFGSYALDWARRGSARSDRPATVRCDRVKF
ncbi:MAG: sulfotransferase [Pseudomonadota bacterium]